MKTLACAAFGLLGLSLVACGAPQRRTLSQQEMITADPLPLAKGATWTYDVTVKHFDPDTNKETVQKLSWTTQVLDAREANGVTAYRIKGWPADLTALESAATAAATETTVLRSGNSFMFGSPHSGSDPSLDGAIGWFSWPMMDGQKFCSKSETVYCWQVAAIETGYKLTSYAGPEEQSFELEPNTGVSRFHYQQHNSTNEIDAKLVSFTKGSNGPANPPR